MSTPCSLRYSIDLDEIERPLKRPLKRPLRFVYHQVDLCSRMNQHTRQPGSGTLTLQHCSIAAYADATQLKPASRAGEPYVQLQCSEWL